MLSAPADTDLLGLSFFFSGVKLRFFNLSIDYSKLFISISYSSIGMIDRIRLILFVIISVSSLCIRMYSEESLSTCIGIHGALNFILNSVPSPMTLEQLILPPIYCTIFLQILSPSPVPLLFICSFSVSFPKSMNNLSIPSGDIPTPVSLTLISKFTNFSFSFW